MTAQLVSSTTPASSQPSAMVPGGPVRAAWRRIRMAVNEMNYATERLMDVRASR
jgi:hypothetical protein